MGRALVKWKRTGKLAWVESSSPNQFRVSPKFKTSKQASKYAANNDLDSYFTVRDKPTTDECKADKLDKYGYFTERMGGKPSTTQLKEREGPAIDAHLDWIRKGSPGGQKF